MDPDDDAVTAPPGEAPPAGTPPAPQAQVPPNGDPPAPAEGSPPADPPAPKPDAQLQPPADPPLSAVEAIRLARQQIEEDARRATQAEELTKTEAELREIADKGPDLARTILNKFEKKYEIRLDEEDRDELTTFVTNLLSKSEKAVVLKHGDKASKAAEEAFTTAQHDFVKLCYDHIDPARRGDFTAFVNGKNEATWLQGVQKFAPGGGMTMPDLIAEAGTIAADPAHGFSDADKAELGKTLKGLKTTKAVINALIQAGRNKGRREPGQPPIGDERGSSDGRYPTLLALSDARANGSYKGTDLEFLAEQSRLLKGT